MEDGLADEVIVVGLGDEVGHPGAEGLAAATAGAVLCVEDVQPDDLPLGEGVDEAVQPALAAAVPAAGRARVGLGLAADWDYLLAGLHAHGLRSWVTGVSYRCPRTQALSVNPSTTYGFCRSRLRGSISAECRT